MKLVHKYRERYNVTGLFENEVYDGIYDTLKALKAQGAHLAVATAKPQIPTEQILERFELDEYFDSVIGSLPDGSRLDKKDIIALALTELTEKTGINVVTGDASNAVMIGDRFYDIKGGQACGIHTMGVLYGYGSREELIEAGADYTPDLPKDILRCYNA
jgi:phosphoglycolate phosphatase